MAALGASAGGEAVAAAGAAAAASSAARTTSRERPVFLEGNKSTVALGVVEPEVATYGATTNPHDAILQLAI